jgi:hypothetical protein
MNEHDMRRIFGAKMLKILRLQVRRLVGVVSSEILNGVDTVNPISYSHVFRLAWQCLQSLDRFRRLHCRQVHAFRVAWCWIQGQKHLGDGFGSSWDGWLALGHDAIRLTYRCAVSRSCVLRKDVSRTSLRDALPFVAHAGSSFAEHPTLPIASGGAGLKGSYHNA